MSNRILIVETWDLKGLTHAEVNAAVICSIARAWPDATIHIVGHDDHVAALKAALADQGGGRDFQFKSFDIDSGVRYRPLRFARMFVRIQSCLTEMRADRCFFLSVPSYYDNLLQKLISFSRVSVTFHAVVHWASILTVPRGVSLLKRWMHRLFNTWHPRQLFLSCAGPACAFLFGRAVPENHWICPLV